MSAAQSRTTEALQYCTQSLEIMESIDYPYADEVRLRIEELTEAKEARAGCADQSFPDPPRKPAATDSMSRVVILRERRRLSPLP